MLKAEMLNMLYDFFVRFAMILIAVSIFWSIIEPGFSTSPLFAIYKAKSW